MSSFVQMIHQIFGAAAFASFSTLFGETRNLEYLHHPKKVLQLLRAAGQYFQHRSQ